MFSKGVRGFLRETWPLFAAIAAILVLRPLIGAQLPALLGWPFKIAVVSLVGVHPVAAGGRPPVVFASVALVFVLTSVWSPGFSRVALVRSFFGVHQVIQSPDGNHHLLLHGTTIHGAMQLREDDGSPLTGRPEPLTYYYMGGPLSETVKAMRASHGLERVAVVGLGAGTLACHRQGAEDWTFYEIDPEVVRIARNPQLFRFMSECAPQAKIVLGDARLTLAATPERYDLIILDAFSSDLDPGASSDQRSLCNLSPAALRAWHAGAAHFQQASRPRTCHRRGSGGAAGSGAYQAGSHGKSGVQI